MTAIDNEATHTEASPPPVRPRMSVRQILALGGTALVVAALLREAQPDPAPLASGLPLRDGPPRPPATPHDDLFDRLPPPPEPLRHRGERERARNRRHMDRERARKGGGP
jgi:hypothetical protein